MNELRLDSLSTGIPALTSRKAGMRMEACVWCLLECGHVNGVHLKVIEKQNGTSVYKVLWPDEEVDITALYRAYNKNDGPEPGAEAIALLLIREKTDYTAIERSVVGTGFDYWLGYKTQDEQIFTWRSARLEISGILQQSPSNKLKYRVNNKTEQTKRSDYTGFPAYVVVVEFDHPKAEMVLRNV